MNYRITTIACALSLLTAFACTPRDVDTRTASSALAPEYPDAPVFGILATNSAAIGDDSEINAKIAVLAPANGTFGQVLEDGVRLSAGTFARLGNFGHPNNSDSMAYTAIIRQDTELYRGFFNTTPLDQHRSGIVALGSFPTVLPYPPRARPVTPGTTALVVASSTTRTITSTTSWLSFDAGDHAVLELAAGSYQVESVELGDHAEIKALGSVELRVRSRFFAGEDLSLTAPTSGSADDLRIEVLGKNGAAGLPSSLPHAVDIGAGSTIHGILFAPNGTLRIDEDSSTIGAVVARDIRLERGNDLVYQDGLTALTSTKPYAYSDAFIAREDHELEVAAEGVLANDLHRTYAPLTAELVASTAHGTLTFNSDGGFTYDPFENFVGDDTFTYRAELGATGIVSTQATVTIHVDNENDVPVIRSFPSATAFVGQLWRYTVQCADPDAGDTLTYTLENAPSGMSVSGNLVSWTPGAVSTASFNVVCSDAEETLDVQPIELSVIAAPAITNLVIYAVSSVTFGGTSVDGSIGVRDTGTTYLPSNGARATIASGAVVGEVPGADLYADKVRLAGSTTVRDVYTNTLLQDDGTRGAQTTFPAMPTFPSTSAVTPGSGTLTVAANTDVTLSPSTSYATFTINNGGCLFLEAGLHQVQDVAVGANGCMVALGAVDLRIAGRLTIGDFAYVGPVYGQTTDPADMHI